MLSPNPPDRRRVLCVDDEAAVLVGLQRNLGLHFDVHTAESAQQAREILEASPPFATVVSDMRMPVVDGVTFLKEVGERWPETSRILLTGQADIPSAVSAVNEGGVFRFLTKPCPSDILVRAVSEGVRQHDLIEAERVLLDQTLRGTIDVMTEALSLLVPRSAQPLFRMRRLAQRLCRDLQIAQAWNVDIACVLSYVATLTLPPELLLQLALGNYGEIEARSASSRANVLAQRLAARIPRLEPVRDLLRKSGSINRGQLVPHDEVAVWILRVCMNYGKCLTADLTPEAAYVSILGRSEAWPNAVQSLVTRYLHVLRTGTKRSVTFYELVPGMTLVEPVYTDGQILLVPADTEVTEPLIEQLRNFVTSGRLEEPMWIREGEHE
jgi:ActR/RegA family two-component response regulator